MNIAAAAAAVWRLDGFVTWARRALQDGANRLESTKPTRLFLRVTDRQRTKQYSELECGPMPNVVVALPNVGGALCSTPQSLADAHYYTVSKKSSHRLTVCNFVKS